MSLKTYVAYSLALKGGIKFSMSECLIYSNKKDTPDFHGTVSFDPIKMSQQKIYQNVYQTTDTLKLAII